MLWLLEPRIREKDKLSVSLTPVSIMDSPPARMQPLRVALLDYTTWADQARPMIPTAMALMSAVRFLVTVFHPPWEAKSRVLRRKRHLFYNPVMLAPIPWSLPA